MSHRPLPSRSSSEDVIHQTVTVGKEDNKDYELPTYSSTSVAREEGHLPQVHLPHRTKRRTKGIRYDGESGRRGFHPWKFLVICFNSSCTLSKLTNLLWPFVPAALTVHYTSPNASLWNFILPYIAMVPAANLLGFAGQEFSRKMPHVLGSILETTFGSIVEIVLLMELIVKGDKAVPLIRHTILGSILANQLLCLGICFVAGGVRRQAQEFHEAVSEVGSNLLLVAAMGLIMPSMFSSALSQEFEVQSKTLRLSRGCALVLFIAYGVYVFFQMRSHHGIYKQVLKDDETKGENHEAHKNRERLTLIESLVALAIASTVVCLVAYFLVLQIKYVVEKRDVKEAFLGLILIPLVEKAAEHITAVDEAWDNHMNVALSHILGASIQTALFNTPLVVFVGWGLGYKMDLNFEIYDAATLILSTLVVGNFLRDGKSNYLEGMLCIFVYFMIATAAWYYPDQKHVYAHKEVSSTGAVATGATRMFMGM